MVKILHTGDLHVTEGDRLETTREVLAAIGRSGVEHRVDAFLVAGDCTGTTVPHTMTVPERDVLMDAVQAWAAWAPVHVIAGNHDEAEDLAVLRRLATEGFEIHVHTRAALCGIETRLGALNLAVLPYFSKASALRVMPPGLGIEQQNAVVEQLLDTLLSGWDAELRADPAVPRVLLAHLNVRGSRTAGGEVLIGREVELDRTLLDRLGFDYVALGHIHLAQQVGERAWFAGSPDRSNFGESDEKGWNIVTVERGAAPIIERVVSPARRFVTVTGTWDQVDGWRFDQHLADVAAGAEVRLRLRVPDAHLATADLAGAEAEARRAGALRVQVEAKPVVTTRLRAGRIVEAHTLAEKLEATFETWGAQRPRPEDAARALEKLAELEASHDADPA